ncbi:ABC transporter permease [Aeromicrobium sp. P5_D10]
MSNVAPLPTGIAIVALLAITLTTASLAGVRVRADAVVATVRAALQLIVVALVIAWIFRHPEYLMLYLGVMVTAATVTSARRIGCGPRLAPMIGLAIVLGAGCAIGPVLASGALPLRAETVVPFTAQIIGGTMTAVSLTGSRMRDDVARDWGQIEAWLSLGASPRQAVADVGRLAASRALIPGLDQTRSAGLVTLPGAFVGLLLGGASPAEAAQVQLLVLAGLLAAQTVAAVVTARWLAAWLGTTRPQLVV